MARVPVGSNRTSGRRVDITIIILSIFGYVLGPLTREDLSVCVVNEESPYPAVSYARVKKRVNEDKRSSLDLGMNVVQYRSPVVHFFPHKIQERLVGQPLATSQVQPLEGHQLRFNIHTILKT